MKTEFLGSDYSREIVVNAVRADVLDAVGDPPFGECTLQVGLQVRFTMGNIHTVEAGGHNR